MTTPPIQTLTDEQLSEFASISEYDDDDNKPVAELRFVISRLIEQFRTLRAETERLQRFEDSFSEWHDKTEWVQSESPSLSDKYLGCHRADVMRDIIESLRAENAELRKDAGRYRWLRNQSMEYRQNGPAAIMAEASGEKGTYLELEDLDTAIDTSMEQAK